MNQKAYDEDGFPECAAEIEWIVNEDGIQSASLPYWIRNPNGPFSREEMAVFEDIAERAKKGDEEAQRKACRMVAAAMRVGVVAPPYVADYVRSALHYFGAGEAPLKQSFTPFGRQSPVITKARKRFRNASIYFAVSDAIKQGMVTSKDGDPGPAFEYVAKRLRASSATVRDIYYRAKKRP